MLLHDGTARERLRQFPREELARGPVWVIDEPSGRRYWSGTRAFFDGGELVLVDGEVELARIPLDLVRAYERVTAVDLESTDLFGCPLWDDLPENSELVLVRIGTGDAD